MSLDVYLIEDTTSFPIAADYLQDGGFVREAEWLRNYKGKTLYEANITHNLGKMADAAGIYYVLWRPEELGITHARQLIDPVQTGLRLLKSDPDHYRRFNASNGWGTYDAFVPWVERYLLALKQYPDALVEVCR